MFLCSCRESIYCYLDTDSSFIIAPNNIIVGKKKSQQVCSGDASNPSQARECYPNGKYDFKAGDTIDFSWGMVGDQEGKLLYGVIPAAAAA